MKIIRRILFAIALALTTVTVALAGDALDRVKRTGILTVATNADWAPQSFFNDENEMEGFDIDVATEIARRMDVEVEFVTPDWTVLTSGKWAGQWDVSVGSMTPTAERGRVLDFPGIYYYSPVVFVVHKDSSAQTKIDLNGKRIGACIACTGERYLQHDLHFAVEGVPPFVYDVVPGEIISVKDPATLLDDLKLGDGVRLDGALDSPLVVRAAIEAGAPFRVLGTAFSAPLAVAIDKGDAGFNNTLKNIIRLMHEDGTLSELSKKWHGVDYSKSYRE